MFLFRRRPHRCRQPVATAKCLVCGTPVGVDPMGVIQLRDYAAFPCTACSALVPVAPVDALRALQEQVREELERARGAARERAPGPPSAS